MSSDPYLADKDKEFGIARALYRKPEILILDEATVSLDRDTEKYSRRSFKLKGDKTLILISQNLNILQNCDKIFELKKGTKNVDSSKN